MANVNKGDFRKFPIVLKTSEANYLKFINAHFVLAEHQCPPGSRCFKQGVRMAWVWKGGIAPKQARVDDLLWAFNAYQGTESRDSWKRRGANTGDFKQSVFIANFDGIVKLIAPLRGKTLLCDWDPEQIRSIYTKAIGMLGSTVVITKTLHFLLPELFLIVDYGQIYKPLKAKFFWGEKFNQISSAPYVRFMEQQKADIYSLIGATWGATLRDGDSKPVNSGDDFRNITQAPIPVDMAPPPGWNRSYTLGKLVDDALRPEPSET
jgi:hypothetical protein